jgi:hypothetical protein
MLALMALAGGGSALANLVGKQRNTIPDPRQWRDEVTLSDADIGGIRAQQMGQLQRANLGTQQNIKQMAGANRMPGGATLSALAGSSYNLARGASEIEAPLQELKLGSEQQYAGMERDYAQGGLEAGQANRDMWAGTIGDMAGVGLLLGGGLFDTANAGRGLAKANTPGTLSGLQNKGIGMGLNRQNRALLLGGR